MRRLRTSTYAVSLVLVGLGSGGCGADAQGAQSADDCREGPGDDVKMGAKTAGQAVEAGAETGVAGVKQLGKGVGGLFKGGTEGAEEGWNDGKQETLGEAREGREEVRDEATLPPCR
jgi:hypothetical protein